MGNHFTTARALEKLQSIQTENFSIEQLKELSGYKYSLEAFRAFMYVNKIPFKRKKVATMKPLLEKLHGIDTKNISIEQIADILKFPGTQENLIKHLKKNSIEFLNEQK